MALSLGEVESERALRDGSRLTHGAVVQADEVRLFRVQVELEALRPAQRGLHVRGELFEGVLHAVKHRRRSRRRGTGRACGVADADHLVGLALPQNGVPCTSTVLASPTIAGLRQKLAEMPR